EKYDVDIFACVDYNESKRCIVLPDSRIKDFEYGNARIYSVIGSKIQQGIIAPQLLKYYDKSYQPQSFVDGDVTSLAIYKKFSKEIKQAYNQYIIVRQCDLRNSQMMRLIQVGYAAFWNGKLGEISDETNGVQQEIFTIPTEKAIKEVKLRRDEKRMREQRSYESDMAKIKARKKPTFSEGMTLENARLSSYDFQNDLNDYVIEDQ
ncbi:MAG: hypothetical protein EZS28_030982, partial [Streblomastix strix]